MTQDFAHILCLYGPYMVTSALWHFIFYLWALQYLVLSDLRTLHTSPIVKGMKLGKQSTEQSSCEQLKQDLNKKIRGLDEMVGKIKQNKY